MPDKARTEVVLIFEQIVCSVRLLSGMSEHEAQIKGNDLSTCSVLNVCRTGDLSIVIAK
jgi:hypothetical protein